MRELKVYAISMVLVAVACLSSIVVVTDLTGDVDPPSIDATIIRADYPMCVTVRPPPLRAPARPDGRRRLAETV
jgi:hypothetical protein